MTDRRHPVLIVLGTRPEAVKLAPLILVMRASSDLMPVVAVTGQHRAMLDQVFEAFGLVADHDLDLGRPGQTLGSITSGTLQGLESLIDDIRPAAAIVQGDTTSAFAAALACFYAGVPIAHVEAGLRSGDLRAPYPEEGNRRLITQITNLHLAPTPAAAANLLAEGTSPRRVLCTGNTVIDALRWTAGRVAERALPAEVPPLDGRRLVLVTVHRRESWGAGITGIAGALARVARDRPDVLFVLPAHANPAVRASLAPLAEVTNVAVTEPLGYLDFVRILAQSHLVVTDSGGVQEEGPALDVPVLVLREVTERPEGVEAGAAALIGTDPDRVYDEVSDLLADPMRHARMAGAVNPFGDGRAAHRCIAGLRWSLGTGRRPTEYVPGGVLSAMPG